VANFKSIITPFLVHSFCAPQAAWDGNASALHATPSDYHGGFLEAGTSKKPLLTKSRRLEQKLLKTEGDLSDCLLITPAVATLHTLEPHSIWHNVR
jgi:hypothetical protein